MEETIITFETAKLAKEKGFDFSYVMNNELTIYSLITQSVLQKWLRENYNNLIAVYSNASGYCWEHMDANGGTHRKDSEYSGPNDSGCWDTYEEALEIGLQEALKLIK